MRAAWLMPTGGGWHSGDPCRIPCRDYQLNPGMGTRLDVEDIKWTGACVGVPVNELKGKSACATGWLAGWGKWSIGGLLSCLHTAREPVPLHGLDPGLQVGSQPPTLLLSKWSQRPCLLGCCGAQQVGPHLGQGTQQTLVSTEAEGSLARGSQASVHFRRGNWDR